MQKTIEKQSAESGILKENIDNCEYALTVTVIYYFRTERRTEKEEISVHLLS